VDGTYQKRIYFQGKTYEEPTVHFDLKLKGVNWFVHYSRWNGDYDFADAQYHGTNISLVVFIRSGVVAARKRGESVAPNVALGTIYRGEVPNLESTEDLAPIWLAYLSGSYFKNQTNDFAEPPFARDPNSAMHYGPPHYFKMQAFWTLTDSKPPFISHLAYLSGGYATNAMGKPVKRQAPYDQGFTNSYYQVESFTNIGGLDVPLVSSFKVFRQKPDAIANMDLDLLFEYRINLERATSKVADFPSEQWLDVTACQDYRVKTDSGTPFACYYANNRWPTDEEALKMAVSNGKFIRNIDEARDATRKLFIKVFLYTILLLPALALLLKLVRTRPAQEPSA
jgi:hypothetical protein